MNQKREYLTETELENLIREIEQSELVFAPPGLQEQILEVLESMEDRNAGEVLKTSNAGEALEVPEESEELKAQRTRDKIIEFRRYRFRVMTTVAAAVLVVFLLPRFENLRQQKAESVKPVIKQDWVMQTRYETKEEALNDSGMLETLLGGVNIFANNSRFNLFRE